MLLSLHVKNLALIEEEEVTFCSLADAKEYLASRFDISRTRLRTADQIYEAARSNHLKVVIQ